MSEFKQVDFFDLLNSASSFCLHSSFKYTFVVDINSDFKIKTVKLKKKRQVK